jgi:hypothetical protein
MDSYTHIVIDGTLPLLYHEYNRAIQNKEAGFFSYSNFLAEWHSALQLTDLCMYKVRVVGGLMFAIRHGIRPTIAAKCVNSTPTIATPITISYSDAMQTLYRMTQVCRRRYTLLHRLL